MEEQAYDFSAIRGVQAGREYYVIMCPFKLVPKIFLFNEEEIPPELRSQRTLNKARIPEMARYIIDNPKEYCFSAITASVDGDVEFKPFSEDELGRNVGHLKIDMASDFIINDGQHRRAAIEQALNENSDIGFEKICVVLFVDKGLKKSQQMFADLNKHAVRPSGSIAVLYDHRDQVAELTRNIIFNIDVFRDMIELEKTSISNRSRKLFTLHGLYLANKALLGKTKKINKVSKVEEKAAKEYWDNIVEQFQDWKDIKERKIDPAEFRRDYVHAHGVLIHALGVVGGSLLANYSKTWKEKVKLLKKIDWSRRNVKMWEGRAMLGGRMSAAAANILLTSSIIKQKLGMTLSPEEQKLEKSMGGK